MSTTFGSYLRGKREKLREQDPTYTVRKFAAKIGVQPSYISKVEREEVAPPSEATIIRMAEALRADPDVLLALAGKVSADLRDVIMKRPALFADLIRQLKDAPDHAVLRVVREVRDGNW
jgi:transcriptional regulator with XRE-family HTH domain